MQRWPLRGSAIVRGFLSGLCLFVSVTAAQAGDGDTERAVRGALTRWMEVFNARDQERVCDLFAPDLAAIYRGVPDRDFAQLCAHLRQVVVEPERRYRYAPEVKAILASADLAAVQVVWTLQIRDAAGTLLATSLEPSLDVFRRQPDGSWKIARFLAYEVAGP